MKWKNINPDDPLWKVKVMKNPSSVSDKTKVNNYFKPINQVNKEKQNIINKMNLVKMTGQPYIEQEPLSKNVTDKIANIAGDVGTLATNTLNNFGFNLPGDIIKAVAPNTKLLNYLPHTTNEQYQEGRTNTLGENLTNVGNAANFVAATELGTGLAVKGVKTTIPYVKNGIEAFIAGNTKLNKITDPVMKIIYKPIVKKAANQVTNYVKNSNKKIYEDIKDISVDELINATQVKPFDSKTALAYYNRGISFKDPRYFNLKEKDYLTKPKVVINPYKHITRNPLSSLRHEFSHYYDFKNKPAYQKIYKKDGQINMILEDNSLPRSRENHLLDKKIKEHEISYYEQPTEVMARIFTNKSIGKNTIDQYDRLIKAGWENSQLSKLWKQYSLIPGAVATGTGLSSINWKNKK